MVSPGSSAAPFGASPETLLDVAVGIAENGAGRVPPETLTEAARASAPLITQVEPAKVRAGMEAVILGRSLEVALQWMHEAGLLAVLLPELEATVDFSQEAGRRHKDVWEHTKQVVRQSVPKPLVRWAALLHDIGKVPTRVMLPDGRVTFHRHAEVGARMFDTVGRRLGFDRTERHKIRFLILHHLRGNAYEPGWTDAAVRRFDHEMGEHLEDLLDLSRADVTSRRPGPPAGGGGEHSRAQGAHPGDPRARRAHPAAAARPGQRDHGGVQPAAVAARGRHPQAVPRRRRAGRARGAPRRRVLRRLSQEVGRDRVDAGRVARSAPVVDAFEGLVALPVAQVAAAAAQRADLVGPEGHGADRDHGDDDGDRERHGEILAEPRFKAKSSASGRAGPRSEARGPRPP